MTNNHKILQLLEERASIYTGSAEHRAWKRKLARLQADLDSGLYSARLAYRDTGSADGAASTDDDDDPIQWSAIDSGLSSATGPNDQAAQITRLSGTALSWVVTDGTGKTKDSGISPTHDHAKATAEAVMKGKPKPLTVQQQRAWQPIRTQPMSSGFARWQRIRVR